MSRPIYTHGFYSKSTDYPTPEFNSSGSTGLLKNFLILFKSVSKGRNRLFKNLKEEAANSPSRSVYYNENIDRFIYTDDMNDFSARSYWNHGTFNDTSNIEIKSTFRGAVL